MEKLSSEKADELERLSDLAYKMSEELFDDGDKEGTGGILYLCDQLYQKIDKYLGLGEDE